MRQPTKDKPFYLYGRKYTTMAGYLRAIDRVLKDTEFDFNSYIEYLKTKIIIDHDL